VRGKSDARQVCFRIALHLGSSDSDLTYSDKKWRKRPVRKLPKHHTFPDVWHSIHRRRLPLCPTAARLNRDPERPFADFAHSGYLQTSRPHFSSVRRARCHADAEPRTLPQGALDGVAADIVGAGVELGTQQRLRMAKMVLLRVAGSRCGSSAILCRVLPGGEFLNLNDAATGHLRLRLGKAGFFFAALSPPSPARSNIAAGGSVKYQVR